MNLPLPEHAPRSGFPLVDGRLMVNGVPLQAVAERAGRTPFYVMDRGALCSRVALLRQHLPADLRLHYAMKANPHAAVLGVLVPLVDGIDVASEGEMRSALQAGALPAHVSFAGPGKREAELHAAVAAGILVNVESARELPLLQQAARAQGRPARVALRLNPDFELKGSGMRMGGGAKPFGVDVEQAPAVLQAMGEPGLAFEGFHVYAGSQNLQAAALLEAQRLSLALVERLAVHAPCAPRHLNLGGGFGIPYFPGEQPLDLAALGQGLQTVVAQAQRRFEGVEVAIELGRYLVGEAGLYVTRVLDRKVSGGQVFLVVDGGLHHHLAASGNFGQVIRKNYPVAVVAAQPPDGGVEVETELVSVTGPLCTPLDLLADRMRLPRAHPGDFVVVFQSGAYGASASPQAFLGHPPPVELLV